MASLTTLHSGRPCRMIHSEVLGGPSLWAAAALGSMGPQSSPGRSRNPRWTKSPYALPLMKAGLNIPPGWTFPSRARPCRKRHPC